MTVSAVTLAAPDGKDGYAYLNTAAQGMGFHGTPTWTLVDDIMDLDIDPYEMEMYKASIRRSAGFNSYLPTMLEMGIKFKMLWMPADTLCAAILYAFQNRKALDMMFLDGPSGTTGSQGARADWVVSKMPRAEHLSEGMVIDVELKPGLTANAASWFSAP
jgi:hypothetical protein